MARMPYPSAVCPSSVIWAGVWLLVAAGLSYFPERYASHAYVPLAWSSDGAMLAVGLGDRAQVVRSTDFAQPSCRRGLGFAPSKI